MRSVDTGINTRQNFDPYDLKVLFVKSDTSEQMVANALNETKQANGWLILVYHKIEPARPDSATPNVENNTISPATFASHIATIQKSTMPVLPVGSAYNELVNQ
jgi:hypothetical protein